MTGELGWLEEAKESVWGLSGRTQVAGSSPSSDAKGLAYAEAFD